MRNGESRWWTRGMIYLVLTVMLLPLSLPMAYAAQPPMNPPKKGWSTKQKVVALAGAALLPVLRRTRWRGVWAAIFLRKVPHVNWLYTLGSATLFVVAIQMVTGILLTLYYVPTPDHAYDSVVYITTQVPAGWFIRGLHHWGASAMVVLTVLHMLRVFFYGAYKFPREVTWLTGVVLLLIAVGFGFTGYLPNPMGPA